jgi:hypothetical protein
MLPWQREALQTCELIERPARAGKRPLSQLECQCGWVVHPDCDVAAFTRHKKSLMHTNGKRQASQPSQPSSLLSAAIQQQRWRLPSVDDEQTSLNSN